MKHCNVTVKQTRKTVNNEISIIRYEMVRNFVEFALGICIIGVALIEYQRFARQLINTVHIDGSFPKQQIINKTKQKKKMISTKTIRMSDYMVMVCRHHQ